jgi:hypothetical protein
VTLDDLADRFDATPAGAGFMARCPVHADDKASLSISERDDKLLLNCFAGCATEAVVRAVGLTMRDLFVNGNGHTSTVVAEYLYRNLDGEVCYRKQRTASKQFYFAKPDGHGDWITSATQNGGAPVMQGVSRLVYRLNELHGHRLVFIVEGERDADRIWSLGLPATTNDAGASQDLQKPKWTDALTAQLTAIGVTDVVCLPDNDAPGRAHMQAVARSCTAAGLDARLVTLPDLPPKGDVSDFLDAGHTAGELVALCDATAVYGPPVPEDRSGSARQLTLQPASELSMRRAVYLWESRVPVGMLSLLAGREGIGKSLISQTIAADLTRGRLAGCHHTHPKGVIIVATEDAWEYVILPRLAAAGADVARCFRVNITTASYGSVELSLPDDLPALTPLVTQHDVALLLLDPIISRLGAKLDTHVDAEVRQALEPLRAFAEALQLAVVGIIHPNKSQPGIPTDPLNMIMGSRAFSAVSRSTLFLQADPEIARLYLLHIKNNVGPPAPTLECAIRDALAGLDEAGADVHAPRVDWLGARDPNERWQTLLDELRRKAQATDAPDSARTGATEFLEHYLAKGPAASTVVIKAASQAGITKRTLQRAAEDLGVNKTWTSAHPPSLLWSLAPPRTEPEI